MRKELFGYVEGTPVYKYFLSNGKLGVVALDYGATIQSFTLNTGKDNLLDIVCGYNTIEEYQNNKGYLGATIGRVANRIKGAQFTLNGKIYNLSANNNKNCLHGGIKGFDKKIWQVCDYQDDYIVFSYLSKDNEEGFPGNLKVRVKFSLVGDSLKIEYSAKTDRDTIVSLTNHSYFNLNGQGRQPITSTQLYIDADYITAVDNQLIPTGENVNVENTIYDFKKLKEFCVADKMEERGIKELDYDVNYVLNGNGYRRCAVAYSPISNVKMEVYTDQPGVQLYTERILNGVKGKDCIYNLNSGFCLETQGVPDAINNSNFPNSILRADSEYKTTTEYKIII